jgi:hypothetical protein
MSYKIFDGFRLVASSMGEITEAIDAWRPSLEKLQTTWLAKLQARMISEMIDEAATTQGRHEGKTPLDFVLTEILGRQAEINRSGLRDPEVDPDFKISIFAHGTSYYGIVDTERRQWLDAWLAADRVEDFSYWDNSERNMRVSASAWKERRGVWKSVLASRPEVFDCTLHGATVTEAQILAAMPDFETRVSRQARRLAQELEMARRYEEMNNEESSHNRFDRLVSIVSAMPRWLNEAEGVAAVNDAAALAQAVLPSKIDGKLVMSPIPHASIMSRHLAPLSD